MLTLVSLTKTEISKALVTAYVDAVTKMWSGVRLTWKAPLGRSKLDCKCSLSRLAVVPFQVGRAVFGTVLTHRSVLRKKKGSV